MAFATPLVRAGSTFGFRVPCSATVGDIPPALRLALLALVVFLRGGLEGQASYSCYWACIVLLVQFLLVGWLETVHVVFGGGGGG